MLSEAVNMKRIYEIHPRLGNLGGGWKLTLIEDGNRQAGECSRCLKMIPKLECRGGIR